MTAVSLVAILGAGEIGSAAARTLAARGKIAAVKLIDEYATVAAGKALDLNQASPVIGSDTRIQADTDYRSAAGADIIILADPAQSPGTEWVGEPALALIRTLHRMGCFDRAVFVFAGAGQRELMQQALDELTLPRRRVIGSAPEALASTARSLVALEGDTSAGQVTLSLLGRPPDRMVIPWSEGSIAGSSIHAMLTAPQLRRVEARLKGLWPPGTGALGTAAAMLAEAVVVGSRRFVSAYVSLDRDNGTRAPVGAWPVSLGRAGLERVGTPALTGRDRVVMDEVLE
jgi:malate dehydrogenase